MFDSSSFNWKSFFSELLGESQRACAIVGAAILDSQLEDLLRSYLVDDGEELNNLLQSSHDLAPLRDFGSRITAAYLLGAIDKIAMRDLRVIKEIRNRFGHRPTGLDFNDEQIRKKVESLRVPQLMTTAFERETGVPMPEAAPRSRFAWSVTMLIGHLDQRRKVLNKVRLNPAPELDIGVETVQGTKND